MTGRKHHDNKCEAENHFPPRVAVAAMVHDNETVVGIVFLDNDGRLTIVHGFTNDSQVLEYARAGDYWALAHRLESNNATPEMLRLAADVLRGDFSLTGTGRKHGDPVAWLRSSCASTRAWTSMAMGISI